jgi:nucleotide-binding universal stress UspA family protein
MSVPAVRRIVVGVDSSTESAAALRWACREASLRGAEVHAVHVREANCHSLASYAVPASSDTDDPEGTDLDAMWRMVLPDQEIDPQAVQIRTEVADGLAARVLLERCSGADMLVLGTASDVPGALRSAGPVIRACLRRAPCPVVVIGAAQDPLPRMEPPVLTGVGAGTGATHVATAPTAPTAPTGPVKVPVGVLPVPVGV